MPKFGGDLYLLNVKPGDMVMVGPDGQEFGPAACGDHRSVPITEFATNDPRPEPDGFQFDCEACREQADVTANYAYTHHTV